MAIDMGKPVTATAEPIVRPAGTRVQDVVAWLLVSILMGVAIGALIHSFATAEDRAGSSAGIQATRAAQTVQAYERAWASLQPTVSRVRVTGTGPGLTWVAGQQAGWAENAITGTGPGLVTIAELQAGHEPGYEPTGTGPGLEHLRQPAGPDVATIGAP